jgi:hypothetical protein
MLPVKQRRQTTLYVLAVPIALVILGAITDFADNVSRDFYAVTAQVIPVLLVAVFVQLHGLIEPDGGGDAPRMRLLSTELLFVAILGEMIALAALAFDWPSGVPFFLSCGAVIVVLLLLARVLVSRFQGDS